jgi:uncharacterized protein YyaL (SSP411 family)
MTRSIGYLILLSFATFACQSQDNIKQQDMAHTNRLIDASSPYLQQHAHNPVDWYPWGEEALAKAKAEDKPILVSIGYSACHWCHVMERESFENDSIAAVMNAHFICIKVDREERPDVDQVYMDAVHAMGLNGGWPLNVFLTPDQKPFYGGTYFPPEQWTQMLHGIAKAYTENRAKIETSAEQFSQSLSASEIEKYGLNSTTSDFDPKLLDQMYNQMAGRFDRKKGGMNKAPKFPMPSNWRFLLRYADATSNDQALEQVEKTLEEMAYGGIYDQTMGGFARYSTDADWFAPHFEKMLYDNGQLVSLYSEAYAVTGKALYKDIVYQTVDWLEAEMTNADGGFYAALDADSEGVEGKYYVWTQEELTSILGADAGLIQAYYNTTPNGNWEDEQNILHRRMSDEAFAKKQHLSLVDLQKKVRFAHKKLNEVRSKRIRPGLDNKVLAGWNGIMISGLVDAYNAFGDDRFLKIALKNANFIESNMRNGDGLNRNYNNGLASIDAYLEDYSWVIHAYTSLYQSTFDEQWLRRAASLTNYVIDNFFDESEGMFFYTDKNGEKLIARKKEVFDNVIPASNSVMANNLHVLGILLDNASYTKTSSEMLARMEQLLTESTSYLTNWGMLFTAKTSATAEIVIVGDDYMQFRDAIAAKHIPNKVLMGSKTESTLPLMEGKSALSGKTTIYVCYNKTCKLPVNSVEEALEQLK